MAARAFALSLCLAGAIASAPALAQSDAETQIARERFKEGVAHYDAQEYDKARLAFLQAYALKAHPAVLLNLAQSELRAGRYAEAAQNFEKYIRNNPGATALPHARDAFDEARQRVGEVNVSVNIADAAVMLDGIEVGRSPLPGVVYVMPGSHVLSARSGAVSAEQVLEATAGQQIYVSLQLRQDLAAPAPSAPPEPLPGAAEGVGAPLSVAPNPQTDQPGFFTWLTDSPGGIAAISVGALALGTSAVLAGFANSEYSSANDIKNQIVENLKMDEEAERFSRPVSPCGDVANGSGISESVGDQLRDTMERTYSNACDTFSARADTGDRLKTLSLVSLGIGAVASLSTVVWYLAGTGDESPAASPMDSGKSTRSVRAQISPLIGPNTQGLWLRVAF